MKDGYGNHWNTLKYQLKYQFTGHFHMFSHDFAWISQPFDDYRMVQWRHNDRSCAGVVRQLSPWPLQSQGSLDAQGMTQVRVNLKSQPGARHGIYDLCKTKVVASDISVWWYLFDRTWPSPAPGGDSCKYSHDVQVGLSKATNVAAASVQNLSQPTARLALRCDALCCGVPRQTSLRKLRKAQPTWVPRFLDLL